MQKRKEDRVFKHYFIMYFFVLLIPMIICCTYYSYMFFVINEDDISSRKNDLVHAAARFDAVASETVRLADSLVSKAEVNKFKNMTDVMAYPNTYKINELQTSLPDLYHDNQEMYNYFIFFDNSSMFFIRTLLIIFYKKVSFRYPLHALSIVFTTRKTLIVNNPILLNFKTLPVFINIFLKI